MKHVKRQGRPIPLTESAPCWVFYVYLRYSVILRLFLSVKSIYYYSPACIQVIFRSRDSTCKTVNRATCPAQTDGAALNSVRTQSSPNLFRAVC